MKGGNTQVPSHLLCNFVDGSVLEWCERETGGTSSPSGYEDTAPHKCNDEVVKELAREACIKYWARAPRLGDNFEDCSLLICETDKLSRTQQIVYELCSDKVRLECDNISRHSVTLSGAALMRYVANS